MMCVYTTRSYVVMLGAIYLCVMTFAWASPNATGFESLATFDRIQITGSVDVSIQQSKQQSVVASSHGLVVDIESVDGTLYIEVDELADSRPTVQISMPTIRELVVLGAADVTLVGISGDTIVMDGANAGHGVGHIYANRIRFDHLLVTGSGQFVFALHGRATHQDINIAGSGRYDAEGLLSETSVVEVGGQGQVNIWTEQFLDLNASDTARVTYRGAPWVNTQVSGGAHVQARHSQTTIVPPAYAPARNYTTSL